MLDRIKIIRENMNKLSVCKASHNNPYELFEHSLVTGNGLITVYIPIYFTSDDGVDYDKIDELEKFSKQDMKPLMDIYKRTNTNYKLFIRDVEMDIGLWNESIVNPLKNLSEKCTFHRDRVVWNRLNRSTNEHSGPTLEFVLTYTNYANVIKCIME